MLKKKHSLYFLIPLNVAIWSYFILSFAGFFSAEKAIAAPSAVAHKVLKDTTNYSLLLSYKDPFLSFIKEKRHTVLSSKATPKKSPEDRQPQATKAATTTAPPIKYMGVIRNKTTGVVMGLITFNGQSRIVKPKELIDGVEFRNFLDDSMICRYNNQTMVVKK
jgi:hypothetical protein